MPQKSEQSAWLEMPSGQTLPIRDRLSIGRISTNNLPLTSEKISRRHALIHRQDEGQFWISDLGSRNGTYVNGKLLVQPQRLRDGERFQIGDDEFVFRQSDGPPSGELMGENATTMQDIHERTCWFLVGDIEGFTVMSQRLPAEALGRLVGSWIAECRDLLDAEGAVLNKFLGDGFFAYWPCGDGVAECVGRVASGLKALQARGDPPFRFVVHRGNATFSGQIGGEVLIGPEVNFVFRMEKIAKDLGVQRLLSAPAAARLAAVLGTNAAGNREIDGFAGCWDFHTFD